MQVIGYVRVSTEHQRDGVSVDAQEDMIKQWCGMHGHELVAVHRDIAVSGKNADRQGLQAALKAVCKCKGILCTYSLSRLARSTRDAIDICERLQGCKADLVSLTEEINTTSAAGKMVFRMLAVLAEFERDITVERTRGALAHLRKQNKRISGQVPYGYDLDGDNLRENPSEMRQVARMAVMRGEGLSYDKIAATLNSEGITAKNGGKWVGKTVRGVLIRVALT